MELKKRIQNGERLIGMHINLNDVAVARIAALAGYDYIWIDLEHSNLSLEHLLGHILAIQATGTAAIVRVPVDDLTYVKKVVEMGPDGIIFPMIRDAAQAKRMLDATLYPPYGTRGFGPQNAVAYGFSDVGKYIETTCDNMCRFIQIEHKDAVDCLEELVADPHIDGYIFGANDLSGSIGELGNVFGERVTALIRKSVEILRRHGKYIGLSTGDTSPDTVAYWHAMGADMISAGADFDFLRDGARATRDALLENHKRVGTFAGKTFYTDENLTADIHCSLRPPCVYGAESGEMEIYDVAHRKWQSAPSLVRMADGVMYLTFSGDNYGGVEAPNNYNVIMRSTDGGESFQTILTVDHPDSVRMHEPILWVDGKGTLWHFWAQSYNWWDGRGGVWAMTLSDGVWSAPRRLCDGVMATPPIQSENGDILLPVSIWKRWTSTLHPYPHFGYSGVYISRDGGAHFSYLGSASVSDTTFDENTLTSLADGSLYMTVRCEKRIAACRSTDGGIHWSDAQTVMPHTSSRSYLALLPSGHHLLVTNDDAKERRHMTAFLSTDGCKTWGYKLLLDERDGVSYPAGCVAADGRVYVAYDRNRHTDEEVLLASFTEEDILEGALGAGSYAARVAVKGGMGQSVELGFKSGDEE